MHPNLNQPSAVEQARREIDSGISFERCSALAQISRMGQSLEQGSAASDGQSWVDMSSWAAVATRWTLPANRTQLSAFNSQLSTCNFQLSTCNFWVSISVPRQSDLVTPQTPFSSLPSNSSFTRSLPRFEGLSTRRSSARSRRRPSPSTSAAAACLPSTASSRTSKMCPPTSS